MAEIQTEAGWISGKKDVLLSGKEYFSFQGIPYAKPPIGELRFMPPEPVNKWEGILKTDKPGSACLHRKDLLPSTETDPSEALSGSEDCLYLNVYTPSLNKTLPVMVWIHGGAFIMGDGGPDCFGPQFLVEKDVILVTMNYRLDAFGFLSLEIPECSGNMGLKDQNLAMQWVKNNIKNFGGDPENVTIFGCSAGGVSASLHLVSPLSKKLCNKAILQSGNCISSWGLVPSGKQHALNLAKLLGCTSEQPKDVLHFFKSLPADQLADATGKLRKAKIIRSQQLPFVPTLESESDIRPFLTKEPRLYLKNGEGVDVPVMTGVTSNEGILSIPDLAPIETILAAYPEKAVQVPGINRENLNGKLKEVYNWNNALNAATEISSDQLFVLPMIELTELIKANNNNPVFLYCFDYRSERDFFRKIMLKAAEKSEDAVIGACHADEQVYLFQPAFLDLPQPGSVNAKVVENITSLWANFAATSNPNSPNLEVHWPETTSQKYNFLIIKEKLEVDPFVFQKRLKFWSSLLRTSKENHSKEILETAVNVTNKIPEISETPQNLPKENPVGKTDFYLNGKDSEQVEPIIFKKRMDFWKSMEK